MKEYIANKTNLSDLPEIMLIYNHARNLMNSHDNFQWDEYYPTKEMIIEDINSGNHFTVKEKNQIAIRKCKNCDRYFIAQGRKDELYCRMN